MSSEAEQTTEKIIRAATGLFADLGYEPVSIREIAGVAGVHFSVINYHFGSKHNLYLACLEHAARNPRFDSMMEVAPEDPDPRILIREIALIMLGEGAEPGFTDSCRLVSRDMASANPNYGVIVRHWQPGFLRMARAMASLGGYKGGEPEPKMYAAMFFAMIDNLVQFRNFAKSELMVEMADRMTDEWVADRVADLFLRGVCPPSNS